jgi:organic hydroperoxide reductase OsmC/OhrA
MSGKLHEYASRWVWEGKKGDGTESYATYGRDYLIVAAGKADIEGSADAMFKGDSSRHNPEDLFVAALSACHLLSYLALCARNKISVVSYEDEAVGTMELTPDGGGRFIEVVLRPRVTIASGDLDQAIKLHEKAHHLCFIANSVSCPVRNEPTVVRAGEN